MTLTIRLPPETEQKLLQVAARSGLAPDALAQRLIEQGLNGGPAAGRPGDKAFDTILAPFREEVEQSGMTDDELREFLTEARDEVRAEKRAKRPQGPVAE